MFLVWCHDDDNLSGSQSLMRQLFAVDTVKRNTRLTTLYILLLLLWVDHQQSALSPEMNDWCGFGPCRSSHLPSVNPLQNIWVTPHHAGSRSPLTCISDHKCNLEQSSVTLHKLHSSNDSSFPRTSLDSLFCLSTTEQVFKKKILC